MSAPTEELGGQTMPAEAAGEGGLHELLEAYRDVLVDYRHHADLARRYEEAAGVIDAVNRRLDRSSQALYAKAGPQDRLGTIYTSTGDGGWEPATDYAVQGMPLPFIGDHLVVAEDGCLLLADTNRGVAISNFYSLEIRPKEDEEVQTFSGEEAVGKVKKLGEAGRGRDTTPTVMRDRWGNTTTDPPVDA